MVDAITRAALALVIAAGASAQAPTSSVIVGVVADSNLHPIPNADVSIGGSSVRVTADTLGRFRITRVPYGRLVLIARRIGFEPGVSAIDVDRDTLWLAFTLDPAAADLPAMVVTERSISQKLQDFNDRKRRGIGQFFTRADIDAINPIELADIFRRGTSVRLSAGGQNVLSARYGCPMAIYLDGVPLGDIRLDFLPPPNDIIAIEVYAGVATVPVWVPIGPRGPHENCGAILIWTKDGS